MSSVQQAIDAMWDFQNPAVSEERFRDAIAGTDDVSRQLELKTQLARSIGLQRRFDEAHATLDIVEKAIASESNAAIAPSFATAHVRCLLERGRIFNSSNQQEKAVPLFEQAHRLAHSIHNDHLAVDGAHMVAIVHGNTGRVDLALKWTRNALAFAEKSTQPRARQWRGSLHNNIGWTLHDQSDFHAAMSHFQSALECRIEQHKPEDIRVAKWCIAHCLRSLGRVDEALQRQRDLLEEHRIAGDTGTGFVHEEIAECLLSLDRPEEARSHFAAAHGALSGDP